VVAIIYRELAASVADEESTREAILYLEKFGIYSAGQDFKEATSRVISSLFAVGKFAAEEELDKATKQQRLLLRYQALVKKSSKLRFTTTNRS
jgi:hypothetical protein